MQKQTGKPSKDKGSRWIAKAAAKTASVAADAGASAAAVEFPVDDVEEASAGCYGRAFLLGARMSINGLTGNYLDQFLSSEVQAREGSEIDIDNQKFKFKRPLFSCSESAVWHCDVVSGPTAVTSTGGKERKRGEKKQSKDAAKTSKSKTKSDEAPQQAAVETTASDAAAASAASSSAKVLSDQASAKQARAEVDRTMEPAQSAVAASTPSKVAEPSPLTLTLANHVDSAEAPGRTPKASTPTAEMPGEMTPTVGMGGFADNSIMAPALAFQHAYLQSMTMGFGAMSPPPAPGAPGLTTVMLRNIPNRYTREMLVEQLNQKFKGKYDFLYLPIDFNSKWNVGYAFINFRNPATCQRFFQEYHNKRAKVCLPGFSSMKVCEVSHARVQGRDANMDNLCDDKFIEKLNEHAEWQPLFIDDQGREIPFSKTVKESKLRRKQASSQHTASVPSRMPYPSAVHPMAAVHAAMSQAAMSNMMYPSSPMNQSSMHRPATGDAHSEAFVFLPALLPQASADTVAMLRSVPSRLSRYEFLQELTRHFYGKFDCIFLPGNTKGDGNRRFALINFRNRKHAQSFVELMNSNEGALSSSQLSECEASKSKEILALFEKSLRRLWTNMQQGRVEASGDWQPLLFKANNEPVQPSLVECWGAIGSLGTTAAAQAQLASMASIASAGAVAAQAAGYAKQCAEAAQLCLQVDANAMSEQQAYMQSMSQQNSYMTDDIYDPQMYYSGMEEAMCMEDYSSWYADGSGWNSQYAGAMA